MSFPVPPTDTTTSALVESPPPDSPPYVPVCHATGTPIPRWSAWALVSATCGIVSAMGVGAAIFSTNTAEVFCVAAGPALICGLVGLVNISESNGRLKGRGFAVAGVMMGCMGLLMLTHIVSSQFFSHLSQYLPHFPSDD